MYVNSAYLRNLRGECIAQQRTSEATHYLLPAYVAGRTHDVVVTVRDADIARSAYVDRAQSGRAS